MSVVMQSRASFSNGKAVMVDGISAEILKTLLWRAATEKEKCLSGNEECPKERQVVGESPHFWI